MVCLLIFSVVGMSAGVFSASAVDTRTPVAREEAPRQSDALEHDIQHRLLARLPNAARNIEVKDDHGQVTLSGTVDFYLQKLIASEVTESVPGVRMVLNGLKVAAVPPDDHEVAQNVRWALDIDPATSTLPIKATVKDGEVTLDGEVETVPQKRIAAWIVSDRLGVKGVKNDIRVTPHPRPDGEIQKELNKHFASSAVFDGDDIHVQVTNGHVTLSGRIASAIEKTWARNDSWIPGVTQVDSNKLEVASTMMERNVHRAVPLGDEEIRESIVKALTYDPRVMSSDVDVKVKDHVATLSGVVPNRKARQVAVQFARNTGGVSQVIDDLKVQAAHGAGEAEIKQSLENSLRQSAALANNSIHVDLSAGTVTLSGSVDSYYEKWLAADLADRMAGVTDVHNQLKISGPNPKESAQIYFRQGTVSDHPWVSLARSDGQVRTDQALAEAVREKLSSNPLTEDQKIKVDAINQVVTLSGRVDNGIDRSASIDTAYQAGARDVLDRLKIAKKSIN